MTLSGCAAYMGNSGPSTGRVLAAKSTKLGTAGITIVDVTDAVARRQLAQNSAELFSAALGDGTPIGTTIGAGDVVDIAVWEAPPAVLFGAVTGDGMLSASNSSQAAIAAVSTSRANTLPEQMVDADGDISVPFVGQVMVLGRTPQQVEREIANRLAGKAHRPQVILRIVRNAASTVTVVGEVTTSAHVPLTTRGERLLDVLATVGGVKPAVGKTTIQITRGGHVAALPLDTVIRDPGQNIRMQADDVVTALFQPYSFTALGATGSNAEVNFEGNGLTLVQALGRIGGLRDDRANIQGVFVFRLEDPANLDPEVAARARLTPDGKVPVIYRANLRDPGTFFVAQSFPIRNHDVLFVSNAPVTDFQKFVNIASQLAITGLSVSTTIP